MFSRQAPVSSHPAAVGRDSRGWQLQVWVSFALAVSLCGTGLAWLPGQDLDRAFMVMGYVFSLSTVFVLSKHVRDQALGEGGTPMWSLVVWSGFALAAGLTSWGMWQMAVDACFKAFLMVCWLFLLSSAFTLAKMLRDAFEDDRAESNKE